MKLISRILNLSSAILVLFALPVLFTSLYKAEVVLAGCGDNPSIVLYPDTPSTQSGGCVTVNPYYMSWGQYFSPIVSDNVCGLWIDVAVAIADIQSNPACGYCTLTWKAKCTDQRPPPVGGTSILCSSSVAPIPRTGVFTTTTYSSKCTNLSYDWVSLDLEPAGCVILSNVVSGYLYPCD